MYNIANCCTSSRWWQEQLGDYGWQIFCRFLQIICSYKNSPITDNWFCKQVIIYLLQVIIFLVAMTFYFLVTKRFCGKGPSDACVSITLISTIWLSTILLISLLLAGVKSENTVITASVEQVILLFIFVTHKKARKKLMTILKCKRQSKIPVRYPRPSASTETVLC